MTVSIDPAHTLSFGKSHVVSLHTACLALYKTPKVQRSQIDLKRRFCILFSKAKIFSVADTLNALPPSKVGV